MSTSGQPGPYARLDELVQIRLDFEVTISREPPASSPGSRRAELGQDLSRIRRETEDEITRLVQSGIAHDQISDHLDRTDPARPGYRGPAPRRPLPPGTVPRTARSSEPMTSTQPEPERAAPGTPPRDPGPRHDDGTAGRMRDLRDRDPAAYAEYMDASYWTAPGRPRPGRAAR